MTTILILKKIWSVAATLTLPLSIVCLLTEIFLEVKRFKKQRRLILIIAFAVALIGDRFNLPVINVLAVSLQVMHIIFSFLGNLNSREDR